MVPVERIGYSFRLAYAFKADCLQIFSAFRQHHVHHPCAFVIRNAVLQDLFKGFFHFLLGHVQAGFFFDCQHDVFKESIVSYLIDRKIMGFRVIQSFFRKFFEKDGFIAEACHPHAVQLFYSFQYHGSVVPGEHQAGEADAVPIKHLLSGEFYAVGEFKIDDLAGIHFPVQPAFSGDQSETR